MLLHKEKFHMTFVTILMLVGLVFFAAALPAVQANASNASTVAQVSSLNGTVVADGLVTRKLDDELIILNTNNSCYYGLRNSGADIFDFIMEKKKCSENDIADFLTETYDVSKETALADINDLLAELNRENMLEIL